MIASHTDTTLWPGLARIQAERLCALTLCRGEEFPYRTLWHMSQTDAYVSVRCRASSRIPGICSRTTRFI